MRSHFFWKNEKKSLALVLITFFLLSPLGWSTAKGNPLLSPAAQPAFQKVKFDLVGQAGGEVFAVAENGTYLFAAVGARVYILDKTSIQKREPIIVGKSEILNGAVSTIVAQGNFLFVGVGNDGVRIIDITNPAKPIGLSTYSLLNANYKIQARPFEIIVSNEVMYLNWDSFGWEIVDVANKTFPVRIWKSANDDYCNSGGLAVQGSYAYLARNCDGQFSVIDISDKANPQPIGSVITDQKHGPRVVVGKQYAYVIDMMNGIRVIDIAQPSAPTQVGSINQSWTFNGGAVLHGDFLYLGNWRMGLGVINVAAPANPIFIKNYQIGGYTNKVAILDNYVLMACDLFGVCVADITNPADPVYQATLFFDAPSQINDIQVRGNYLFAANNYDGLKIFDTVSPENPRLIAAYPDLSTAGAFEGFVNCIAVEGDYAYVADNNGLRIIQISNILAPTKVGQYLYTASPGFPGNLVVSGSYAYLTDGNALEIYDIQDKTNPWKVSEFTLSTSAPFISGLAIREDTAFIADYDAGLKIINIHDRAHPQEIGSFTTNLFPVDVVLKDNLALICDALRGLVVLDITNTMNPIEIGSYKPGSPTQWIYPTGIAVHNNLVYLKSEKLWAIDITFPRQPVLRGSFHELSGNDIKIYGNMIFLNGNTAGIYILRQENLPNIYIPLAVK